MRQKKPNVKSLAFCSLLFHKDGCKTNKRSSFAFVRRNKRTPEEAGKIAAGMGTFMVHWQTQIRYRDASRNWLVKFRTVSQSPPKLVLMDCKEIILSGWQKPSIFILYAATCHHTHKVQLLTLQSSLKHHI